MWVWLAFFFLSQGILVHPPLRGVLRYGSFMILMGYTLLRCIVVFGDTGSYLLLKCMFSPLTILSSHRIERSLHIVLSP